MGRLTVSRCSYFQSPPHRGRCCCRSRPRRSCGRSRPFSPLLIGEDAAVRGPAGCRQDRIVHFQSPPHRGRCCCHNPVERSRVRDQSFSPLLIGEDAAVTRTQSLAWDAVTTFSPLLIGEDAAVANGASEPLESHNFQSPPHRGRCCCRCWRGSRVGQRGLSVPSSSGKMLLSGWTGPPFMKIGPFSPLLIGEDAAVSAMTATYTRLRSFQSPPHRGRCCCEVEQERDERRESGFQSPPHRGRCCCLG